MRQASQLSLKLTSNSLGRPTSRSTRMHEADRLNLLPDLKEQRSMQVMQPAHFEASAAIQRSFLVTFVEMVNVLYFIPKEPAMAPIPSASMRALLGLPVTLSQSRIS